MFISFGSFACSELRGAMAFALALQSVHDLPEGHGQTILTATISIVVLSVRYQTVVEYIYIHTYIYIYIHILLGITKRCGHLFCYNEPILICSHGNNPGTSDWRLNKHND
jgi:hypothetical protein